MFFIQMSVNGKEMYLHNYRMALFLPDYARRFKTEAAALRFMRRHHLSWSGSSWKIVEISDAEIQAQRYLP